MRGKTGTLLQWGKPVDQLGGGQGGSRGGGRTGGEEDTTDMKKYLGIEDKSSRSVKEHELHDILLQMVGGDEEALERTGAKSSIAAYLRDRGITVEQFRKILAHQQILKERSNRGAGKSGSFDSDRWAVLAGIKK